MKHIISAISFLTLPLLAQEPSPRDPVFIQLGFEQPSQDLKTHVGSRMGFNAGLGYVFHEADRKCSSRSLAAKLDFSDFVNQSTHREAHSISMGMEYTFYFRPGFKGAYLSIAPSLCVLALTDRDHGTLANQQYVRAGGSIALGYRFSESTSMELSWRAREVDQQLEYSSFGIGWKYTFGHL